jgi:hypothetical protein
MADPRIEKVIGQSDLPTSALADVRAAVDSSPYLQSVMLKAIEDQRLRGFSLSQDPHEGGHYSREKARSASIRSISRSSEKKHGLMP